MFFVEELRVQGLDAAGVHAVVRSSLPYPIRLPRPPNGINNRSRRAQPQTLPTQNGGIHPDSAKDTGAATRVLQSIHRAAEQRTQAPARPIYCRARERAVTRTAGERDAVARSRSRTKERQKQTQRRK
ncbi:hypothetical protein CBL_00450 [Carabus blaptoides fortunei]